MNTIVISYAREDEKWASDLREALKGLKADVWWDKDLPAGAKHSEVILQKISNAAAVIVVWSKTAKKSKWVPDEANCALESKNYIPVAIEKDFEPEIGLRQWNVLDISSWTGSPDALEFKRVKESIEKYTGPLDAGSQNAATQIAATAQEPDSTGAGTDSVNVESKGSGHLAIADPLLSLRLNALRQYLQPMTQMDRYVKSSFEDIPTAFSESDENIWVDLITEIRKDANQLIRQLETIEKSISSPQSADTEEIARRTTELWGQYQAAFEDSQQIFQEAIELIGGLKLRDSLIQTDVWEIADELIRSLARWAQRGGLLALPTPKETFGKTVRRIIHLRFPEWNIWNLPQTAHELGRVLVSERNDLKELVLATGAAWMEFNGGGLAGISASKAEKVRDTQVCRLEVLTADAFATYTMGPAYACTAVMLRLDPTVVKDVDTEPAAFKRVYTILQILGLMDKTAGRRKIYKDIIDQLREKWDRSLGNGNLGVSFSGNEKDRIDEFIECLWQQFYDSFLPKLRYSGEHDSAGWRDVETWSDMWEKEIEGGSRALSVPEPRVTSSLRDAINAAWLCRLFRPEHSSEITEVSNQLCAKILEIKIMAKKRGSGSARSAKRGAKLRPRDVRA